MAPLLLSSAVQVRPMRPSLRNTCPSWKRSTVSNGIKTRQMLVWSPFSNTKYETFSYLPALADNEIAKQVDYITRNGWVPCLEFADAEQAYVANDNTDRFGSVSAGYYDNRYWTMWKLPMFGCNDPGQVLAEINNCRKAFPKAYSRLVAFDPVRQVQIASFVVNHPEMNKKTSYGEEVSFGITAGASSSSSSWDSGSSWGSSSSSWDTSSSKSNDWSYDWNKSDSSSSSSSWDSGAKQDWSYDWNKSDSSSSSSWDTGAKQDWSYDWNKSSDSSSSSSWDTGAKQDWSYDWNKSDSSSGNSWDSGNSWNSSYGANSSAVEDTELRRSMDDVQRKLDQLKSTVNDVMGDNRSSGNDWSSGSSWNRDDAVRDLERSYGSDTSYTTEKKDNAWYSW